MEEFDRQIKSKIDSLIEVPGVEFDEEIVWRKINSKFRGDWFLPIGLILLLAFLTTIFLSKYESQTEITEYNETKESTSKDLIGATIIRNDSSNAIKEPLSRDLIDSSSIQISVGFPISKNEIQEIDSAKGFSSKSSKKSKKGVVQTTPFQQKKTTSGKKQRVSIFESGDQTNKNKKEFSLSTGKDNQTLGITSLKKMNNHFSLTYGLHINRNFNSRFRTNEKGVIPSNTNQIQVPLGIRYNLFNFERRFKLHFSTSFKNSFSISSYTNTVDYNLNFESDLTLDYRIFSTKEGKKGYLRFRLPLYNADIINQGIYRPTLYDALKY